MKYLLLIARNLRRNRRRSVLTVVSIALSVFVFSILFCIPAFLDLILKSAAGSLRVVVVNKAGLGYTLPESYVRRIAALPHVAAVDSWNWFGGVYHDPADAFPNIAVDAGRVDTVWPDWDLPAAARAAFQRERTGCIVGSETMTRFHMRMGQQITLRGTVYPITVPLTIVGEFGPKTMPQMIVFRRDYLESIAGESGQVSAFWVMVDRHDAIGSVMQAIDREFANSPAQTITQSEAAFQAGFADSVRALVSLAEVFALVILVTISMVTANTAAMTTRERRPETALMRALGFGRLKIVALLAAESTMLGLAGGAIGVGAAIVTVRGLALGNFLGLLGAITMPAAVGAEGLGLALLIGAGAGLLPAVVIMRGPVASALRALS